MRHITYLVILILVMGVTMAFGDQISYAGVDVRNSTSNEIYNTTYTVTSYLFYDSSCTGVADYSETSDVTISNGNLIVKVNYTDLEINTTFYIKPSISGDNQTCFQYTMAAQSNKADNATNSIMLQGYSPSTLPILGGITGTLGSSSVSLLTLDAITYTNLLGYNNITKCGNNEILKIDGALWNCENDDTGSDTTCSDVACTIGSDDTIGHPDIVQNRTPGIWDIIISCENITGSPDTDFCTDATGASGDTNTNVTSIQVTNASGTYTINLEQPGLTNLTATFVVTDSDTDTTIPNTNTNVTKIGVVGFGSKTLNLEQPGLTNLTATWVDVNTLWSLNSTVFVNQSGVLGLVQAWFDGRYLDDTTIPDTNTNVTSIQVTNSSGTYTINLEQPGLTNLTATFVVTDSDTDTTIPNTNTNVTSIQVTNVSDVFTINLEQPGLTNLTAVFTVGDAVGTGGGGGNSSGEILGVVNNTALNGTNFLSIPCSSLIFDSGIGAAGICDGDDAGEGGAFDLNYTGDSGEGVILNTELLAIEGVGSVSTVASGNTLTITGTDTNGFNSLNASVLQNESGNIGIIQSFFDGLYLDDTTIPNTNTNVTSIQVTNASGTFTINLEQPDLTNLTATFVVSDADTTIPNTNTNVTSIQVTNVSDVFTINLEQPGLTNLTAVFTVGDAVGTSGGGGNSSEQMRDAINITGANYNFSLDCNFITGGVDGDYCTDTDTDTNGYTLLNASVLRNETGNLGIVQGFFDGLYLDDTTIPNFVWPINTTIFQNESGNLGIVQGIFDGLYLDDTTIPNTNTNATKIQFTNTSDVFTLNLEQPDLTNLTAIFTVGDADTTYSSLSEFGNDLEFYNAVSNFSDKIGNSTEEMRDAINISSQYDFYSSDLICTDCIDGTEIAELTDADVSNTLTCSLWDALDSPSDINAADITNDDTYATTASAETFDEHITFSKNITIESIHFEVDVEHFIYDNSTCMILQGDTATVEIC